MRKKPKKLALSKETVKQIAAGDLKRVAGALETCSCGGPFCDCPDTVRGCSDVC